MKKILLLSIAVCAAPQQPAAQNLVANGSFGRMNQCREYNQPCSPAGWFVIPYGSDYFTPKFNFAINYTFCGFTFYSSDTANTRTWLTTQLLCPLQKDSLYIAEMDVFGAGVDMGKIGIYLPEDDFTGQASRFTAISPAAEYRHASELTTQRGNAWKKLTLRFTATGRERWLVIGNFTMDVPGDISTQYSATVGSRYYYFVDNIILRPAGKNIPLCSEAAATEAELYQRTGRHPLPVMIPKPDTLILPDVLFEVNRSALNRKFQQLLDSLTGIIDAAQIDSLLVNGHTDNTGSSSLNKSLSLRRAETVRQYLITRRGIPAGRCIARGFGSSLPVAGNSSPSGRLKNRRVEIIVFRRQP